MGPECVFLTTSHAHKDTDIPMIDQGFDQEKAIVIEEDVWIGTRSIILPGVRIGKGSIVGAGSVVTKSVPQFSIAAGNPAKVVRSRSE